MKPWFNMISKERYPLLRPKLGYSIHGNRWHGNRPLSNHRLGKLMRADKPRKQIPDSVDEVS